MHPAPSVIIFSTLSGLGFGLLFWLGFGMPGPTGLTAFIFFAIAYLLAVGGLLASTFHLGHPERAIKAFSQWQTSWLSREAWCAVSALVIMAIYGAGLVFFSTRIAVLGVVGAVLSLGTVGTTSMIYAQLKTVPRWHHWSTPAMFLTTSLGGGALLAGQLRFALPLLAIAGAVQLYYWISGDSRLRDSGTTLASATGLKGGSIRAFEPPHTGTNYLLREFVFVVGRKHSHNLRAIGLGLGFGLPILLMILPFHHVLAGLAVISHVAGVFATRWLFFAEAEHVVGLYYGKRTA
ncbi:dimethyl sulfoxide reductase anchor subunit family protein [Flavimaricola marinus]|uniref:DMSO reductase anchor subunit (DmsC) n=1 Tax=Flavimaricola marinus TaxID=1819565 RepID=A0A238LAP6_9RHOB|nr:DmsC/YnfH family molybdoenzyme membrane anchor subunit [Flavimaricola marinus]SMY06708.1 DMSO reductase anchor subunit (DmsC) [Flavimaricola marinus]